MGMKKEMARLASMTAAAAVYERYSKLADPYSENHATEIKGKTTDTPDQQLSRKGLRQWPEYGNVWAATKKAAIKKYNKQIKGNEEHPED
jgi:hypothetical protein